MDFWKPDMQKHDKCMTAERSGWIDDVFGGQRSGVAMQHVMLRPVLVRVHMPTHLSDHSHIVRMANDDGTMWSLDRDLH